MLPSSVAPLDNKRVLRLNGTKESGEPAPDPAFAGQPFEMAAIIYVRPVNGERSIQAAAAPAAPEGRPDIYAASQLAIMIARGLILGGNMPLRAKVDFMMKDHDQKQGTFLLLQQAGTTKVLQEWFPAGTTLTWEHLLNAPEAPRNRGGEHEGGPLVDGVAAAG